MYARFKPFRCRHGSVGGSADSCDYHVTRGFPDQFLRSTPHAADAPRQDKDNVVTRDELISALKEAGQHKVYTASNSTF